MRKWLCGLMLVVVFALGGCYRSAGALPVQIPYDEDESFTYDFIANGQKQAEAEFAVKKDQYDQQSAWLMSMNLDLGEQVEVNEVWTSLTLQPLYSRVQLRLAQGDYDIRARYSEKKISLEADTPQGRQQVERNISGAIYDNAQILMTLRALPLAEGDQYRLSYVQTKNVSRGEMTVKIIGREKVQVPAGEYECYRVEMGVQGVKQYCWYSVDAKRWLIRYDNGQTQFALTKAR